jgi:nitronate monooxygenase
MGAMGLTWTDPTAAREQVRAVKVQTDAPFLVNFVLAFECLALDAVLEEGVPVVSFSWGDPAPFVGKVRRAGARLGVQVTNPDGARRAVDLGADFLIAQGIEAGGHVQSSTPLADLLPRVLGVAGDVPVVASGGIANGAGIARVLTQGAQAAMLGTRFVATQESRAHEIYKQRLVSAQSGDAALTVCFDGGWPYAAHRVLRNETLEIWEGHGCPLVGQRPGEGETVARSASGVPIYRYEDVAPRIGMEGEVGEMALYAGTGCDRINDLPPAADLVARLWSECLEASSRV